MGDIYESEIGIVDGCVGSSYFLITPVSVIDNCDTDDLSNISNLTGAEISIEEDDVCNYLRPFLYKYFDKELYANKNRLDTEDFDWWGCNYYTKEAVQNILNDIIDTIDALSECRVTEYVAQLDIKSKKEIVIDFYLRFISKIEYMLEYITEKRCNLISFIGP